MTFLKSRLRGPLKFLKSSDETSEALFGPAGSAALNPLLRLFGLEPRQGTHAPCRFAEAEHDKMYPIYVINS